MRAFLPRCLAALAVTGALLGAADTASAARGLADYRYFRALTIDLAGRMPTRAEVAAFEADGFDLDGYIDQQLAGPAYAERVRRIYMDLLRLDVGPTFQIVPPQTTLRREQIQGPNGKPLGIYYRKGQRRARIETDGDFCMTQDETGLQFPPNTAPTGAPKSVSQEALDAATVVVKPWWLYRDYGSAAPTDRYDAATWATRLPGFTPVVGLTMELDGTTPTVEIRICKEEAQQAPSGTIFAPKRPAPVKGAPPPYGRLAQLPQDSAYATAHAGEAIACTMGSSLGMAADCGCGVGLERCMPGDGPGFDPRAFSFPTASPLGDAAPLDDSPQAQSAWLRYFWGQEAIHFLDNVFAQDRDFRDVLTARDTWVNGPLTQFYKSVAPAACCGDGLTLGYTKEQPLLEPSTLPALLPHDVMRWEHVADRGPQASGIFTMPVFLTKYGTRRARAHVAYSTFLCRDFISGNVQLRPSTEPNLMIREGCSTCHATLEPLAAYFTRITESGWTFLPASTFPASSTTCKADASGNLPGRCKTYYDPAFADATHAMLRGAYGSTDHAEAGPRGIADAFTAAPEFAPCVAENIASALLARPLTTDDAALRTALTQTLTDGGYKLRALVRALVKSDAYKATNDVVAHASRDGGAP